MPFTAGLGGYQIVWLRQEVELARESSGLKSLDEVLRYAMAKAERGITGSAAGATEFRIDDETGYELARHPITSPQSAPVANSRERHGR